MHKKTVFSLLCFFSSVFSAPPICDLNPDYFHTLQFFGTLLEINKTNQDPGQVFLQPYIYGGYSYGVFNPQWNLNSHVQYGLVTSQLNLYVGLTKRLELDIIGGTYSCFYKKKESTALTDTLGGFSYQFLFEDTRNWTPNFRVLLYGIFPTGKGSDLGDHFNGTNASGFGAWGTQCGLSINKTFYHGPCHPYALNLSMIFSHYFKTKIKGVSFLNGGFQTKGVATPGSVLSTIVSLEYLLIPHVFLALDAEYFHTFSSTFKGSAGLNRDGSAAQIFSDTKDGFVVCPAIEWNLLEDLSIYFGGYFSPFGRNTIASAEGVFCLGYQF